MSGHDSEAVLQVVDLVLGDLRLRGRMFVSRRSEAGQSGTIVIQTGEDGRYRLASPHLGSVRSIETFMSEAQAYLGEVYGQPVPRCPLHDHALVAEVSGSENAWVCPDGACRCRVGEYEELSWPPEVDGGDMAAALSSRLHRRGITGVHRVGVTRRGGAWVARVGVWPMEDWLINAIKQAAAPIAVEIGPEEPASAEANQIGLDRAAAQHLEWARWAVGRWAEFPVGRVPRPLVLIGSAERVDGGFRSGDAKLAFMQGLIETAVPVPGEVLAALRHRPDGAPQPRPGTRPLMITSAVCSETEFRTDRGRHVLQAWRLEADDANGPIWVPDPELASLAWAPAQPPATAPPFQGSPHHSISAGLAADGQTLTFSFIGAVPEIVEYPSAEVVESDQAISIVPLARYIGPPASLHTAVGRQREVLVRLKQPLGARVLVDLDSSPAEVSECHERTGVKAQSIHHRAV